MLELRVKSLLLTITLNSESITKQNMMKVVLANRPAQQDTNSYTLYDTFSV